MEFVKDWLECRVTGELHHVPYTFPNLFGQPQFLYTMELNGITELTIFLLWDNDGNLLSIDLRAMAFLARNRTSLWKILIWVHNSSSRMPNRQISGARGTVSSRSSPSPNKIRHQRINSVKKLSGKWHRGVLKCIQLWRTIILIKLIQPAMDKGIEPHILNLALKWSISGCMFVCYI